MARDYFAAPWPETKPNLPFRQLSMLVTEAGQQIVQSDSIMRYLAQRLGMKSADPLRAAAIHEIFKGSQELFFPPEPDSELLHRRQVSRVEGGPSENTRSASRGFRTLAQPL